MNRFLKSAAITLLMACAVMVAMGLAVNQIPLKNVYTFKYNYMEQNCSSIKTLLMGHSQFEWGLNPHAFGDSTFNLAMSGRVIYYDEALLKRYMPRMENLKTVILALHYSLVGFDGFYGDDKDRAAFIYHYYRDMHIPYPKYFYHYIPYHYKELENDGVPKDVDELGYRKMTKEFQGADSWWAHNQWGQEMTCASLAEIAKLCQQHGVRLIVVTPPSAQAFLNMTTESGMRTLEETVAMVQQDYPLEYHNYIEDSAFREHKLYYDATHLNHTGATLFAERLIKDFGIER